jgi:hypothetical protein
MHFPQIGARGTAVRWALLTALFVLSLPAVTVRFYASDEIEYFAYLRSMWFDGDLSFDNEYRYFYDRGIGRGWRFKETFLDGETATGKRLNFAPVGSAILWSPFYVLTDAGVRAARGVGMPVTADGYSTPYIASVVYASALYGFLAVSLSAYAAARVVGDSAAATASALAVWLGTPIVFYMYLAPGFSHACSAFAVAAFVVIWLHVRRDWSLKGAVALGAAVALMGMVREQDLFIALGPALDFLLSARRRLRDGVWRVTDVVARAAVGTAAVAVCFMPQVLTYISLFGQPAPSSTVQGKMTWTSPHMWRVLLSPSNGLFFWTPLALPALMGLVWLAIRRGPVSAGQMPPAAQRQIAMICLVMAMTQIFIGGALDTWAGAGSFGQRRLVGLTVFFVLGLTAAFVAVRHHWMRYAAWCLVTLAVWWNVGLIAQFGAGLMNRQHLDPARNAYHNFVTIPRQLPELVSRFLFDRASFYQRKPPP